MGIFAGSEIKDAEKQENLVRLLILSLSAVVAFIVRLFAVIRFESIIHEFDPW